MSAKEITALERRYYELVNKGELTACFELCATDLVMHSSSGETRGLEEFKKNFEEEFKAFPDMHFTVHDIIAEGDKVAARWTLTGTHKGEFRGTPPTNKKVTLWGINIDRVAGGKFVEGWVSFDMLSMMQQLGLVPTPKKEK
jgi:steroid delta-isomerase-like uncharacterized protein